MECPPHVPFTFQQTDWVAPEQTVVRALYDDAHLYLGITCRLERPAPPAGILGHLGEHIEVFFDPENRRKGCLQFAVNVSGGTFSNMHYYPDAFTTRQPFWQGWTAQTRVTETGWEVLLTLPLPAPPKEGTIWGFSVYRCHHNMPGTSSLSPYSESFSEPEEYGHLVFGSAEGVELPAKRRPVQWPAELSAKPLELHLTVDPPDDLLGWYLDPERLAGYFRYFAGLGIKRVYWIEYGNFQDGYWQRWYSYGEEVYRCMLRSLATFGNDLLPGAVAAAHDCGLELYSQVKPWDWGTCMILPPNRRLPGEPYLERVGGVAYPLPVFCEHPEWNMMRAPDGAEDDGREIAEIVLLKDDDAPLSFSIEGLSVWVSDENCGYRRVEGADITEAVEQAPVLRQTLTGAEELDERRPVRVIRIRGLRLRQRYVAVKVPGREHRFTNHGFALARAFAADGREITTLPGYLSINGDWPGGESGWQENGIYFEMSGPSAQPGGLGATWALDNPCGVIGLARGRNRYIPGAPEPAHPDAAEWILNRARRTVACGADGFEYRVRNHQVSVEWEAYGYAPAVQEAFRKAHGRDLRLDGSDFDLLCAFRGRCYTDILRRAKAVCAAAGIPFGLQITPDLFTDNTAACTMGIHFAWREWIREGIADQMLTKYISPLSPIFREVQQESKRAGIPFYVEFERHYEHPAVAAIYGSMFNLARRAGADAVNIYEGANVARITEEGVTVSKAPDFEEFLRGYPHG